MIWPDWQYPHWGACVAIHACCKGCFPSGDKPSMVVMADASTETIGVMHERTARPSTCTVQAPHRPMPQPNLVPVNLTISRNTHSKGVCGSVSTVWAWPLTVI